MNKFNVENIKKFFGSINTDAMDNSIDKLGKWVSFILAIVFIIVSIVDSDIVCLGIGAILLLLTDIYNVFEKIEVITDEDEIADNEEVKE